MKLLVSTADTVQKSHAASNNYVKPKLEQHRTWVISTGVSLPINSANFADSLEGKK